MSLNCGGRSLVVRVALAFVPVLSFVVSASAPAVAATRDSRERTARKACLKGDYATGVDLLADLFVDTKEPTYIFNQGRCFEQNRRYGDAIGRFEEYLRLGEGRLSAEARASAEKHIADCKEKLPPEPVIQPPPQPILLPTQGTGGAEAVPPLPPPATLVAVQPAPKRVPAGRRWGLITAGIVTSAVGVGGVVTGVILNLRANQLASDVEKPGGYSAGAESDQENYKTFSMVGYGVGAACVVAGAIMIGFGSRTRAASPSVAFVPAVGAHQVGAVLSGAF
jgi:hypothetical protein